MARADGEGAVKVVLDPEIDPQNIVHGKRKRRRTKRLVDTDEWQTEYQNLILDDVPTSELSAALIDDLGSDDDTSHDERGSSSEDEEELPHTSDEDFIDDDDDRYDGCQSDSDEFQVLTDSSDENDDDSDHEEEE